MESSVNNNKRIAKNTIFLYLRMMMTILISLYTSRIVLNQLGIEDFGINNVVAGVVVMFTCVNGTLASGAQRFLTFALGENCLERQNTTFSTTFFVHLILSVILGIVILVVGTWFVYNKLNISVDRRDIAQIILRWNYQNGLASVPKSSSPKRIDSNFNIFDFELSDSDISSIDAMNQDYKFYSESFYCLGY